MVLHVWNGDAVLQEEVLAVHVMAMDKEDSSLDSQYPRVNGGV